jgi:hypothetical protein
VYVSQPEVKPGCVLRRANFNVLERRGLVDDQQVQVGGWVRRFSAAVFAAVLDSDACLPSCQLTRLHTRTHQNFAPLLLPAGLQAQHEHICVCG